MPNMSYCRFENTLVDLRDCEQAMSIGEPVEDGNELKAKKKLIRLCIEIAKEYGPQDVSNALYSLTNEQLKVN